MIERFGGALVEHLGGWLGVVTEEFAHARSQIGIFRVELRHSLFAFRTLQLSKVEEHRPHSCPLFASFLVIENGALRTSWTQGGPSTKQLPPASRAQRFV